MNNFNNNFNNYPFQNNQTNQQYFIQPQGMVYFINNPNEINSIVTTSNVLVAICIPEETCYVKTIQNNIPNITVYKLEQQKEEENKKLVEYLTELEKRISILENSSRKGGRLDELL